MSKHLGPKQKRHLTIPPDQPQVWFG